MLMLRFGLGKCQRTNLRCFPAHKADLTRPDLRFMDVDTCLVLVCWYVVMVMLRPLPTHAHRTLVVTDKGKVQGRSHTVHGKKVDVFYGIPYARPPVGHLRFLHPEQLDPWDGVLDATQKPNCCIQVPDTTFGNFSGSNVWNPNTKISEDCLYLSVWTPRTNPPFSNKAVMVWIYGGSFMAGSSVLDIYDGKFLAAENDVIVVSMQFRFGALGYFVLGSPDSPGNAGMMDLRMALEWVQRNIHAFGGNAHNVTLVGESSGAVSVGLLMLSSLGRGLFHRAILQSGSPLAPWGTYTLQEGRRRSLALAKRLGCDISARDRDILECLRQVPASRFPEEEINVANGVAQFPFIPVVDGTFLTKTPSQYFRDGLFKKIPVLLGSNANEGSWLLVYAEPAFFNINTPSLISKQSFDVVMDRLFKYYPQYPSELNSLAREAIKFQYMDWLDPNDQVRLRGKVEQAVGDVHFTCGVADMAKVISEYGLDVYFYRFSHRMSTNPWPEWMGVLHGDEIFFVFGQPLHEGLNYTGEEKRLSRKIMKLWTNFAKTGNPNRGPGEMEVTEWPKFKHNEQVFLDINLNLVSNGGESKTGQGVRPQQCAFWDHYVSRMSQLGASYINGNCTMISASTSGMPWRASPVISHPTFLVVATLVVNQMLLK